MGRYSDWASELEQGSKTLREMFDAESPRVPESVRRDHPELFAGESPGTQGADRPRVLPGQPSSDMLDAINELIEDWIAGRNDVEPEAVQIRPLPDDATDTERAIARFVATVKGLWIFDCQRRPMILARTWVAGWLADPRVASIVGLNRRVGERQVGNVLLQLVAWGILERVGSTKIPGQPREAYLYELAAVDELARPHGQQPGAEAVEDVLMPGAEVQRPLGAFHAAVGVAADGERLHG